MNDSFDLQPTIQGETLLLRPLRAEDLEPLYLAASDPFIWEQHPDRFRYEKEAFAGKFFPAALASGGAFAVIERASGRVVGSSRYYEWKPEERSVFIGYTFLIRELWGGVANLEMKRLMLDHAFRWADVVWFHAGSGNWRSRKALEKIGGIYSHEELREVNGVAEPYAFYKIVASLGR